MYRLDIHVTRTNSDVRVPIVYRSHIERKDGHVILHFNGNESRSPVKVSGIYINRFALLRSLLTSIPFDCFGEHHDLLHVRYSLFDPDASILPFLSETFDIVAGDVDYDILARGFLRHVQVFESILHDEPIKPAMRV
jgi:hypothetical protein